MNSLGWILSVAAVVGMALVLIPERRAVPTLMALRASRARQSVRETRPITVLAPAGAVTVGAAVAIQWGATLGVAALVAYGLCAWALSVRSRSALRTTRTEGMARLTTVLANQASTASTVGVALERTAPLVRGSVGAAAKELARGYQRGALADAAREFVTAVPVTAAVWLTDILAVAGRGGAKVSDVLTALEALAASEADAARHFHRRVAAQMVPLVVSLVLSAGTIGGMGLWMPSYGSWLLSPAGQLLVLGGAVATAAVCAPAFAAASAGLKA